MKQEDLHELLLRYDCGPVAFTGDILRAEGLDQRIGSIDRRMSVDDFIAKSSSAPARAG